VTSTAYYDRYWQLDATIPDQDPTSFARRAKLSQALAPLQRGARVLDLGCGKGVFSAHLASLGLQPLGTDLSSEAVAMAKQKFPKLDFEVMAPDGSIPAEDGTVQAVWSSEVIEHVFDVHDYLCEVNRVLVPGGFYILTTPYHSVAKNVVIALTKFDRHFDPEISHIRFFDKAGLTRCLRRAGFEPIKWDGIGRCWPIYRTWFVVAKKASKPGPPPPIVG
jgi:2-polyprenyl-6-hydroxyphenyl methylase/3-demethylubiquinone-9 3-methyltransferase